VSVAGTLVATEATTAAAEKAAASVLRRAIAG